VPGGTHKTGSWKPTRIVALQTSTLEGWATMTANDSRKWFNAEPAEKLAAQVQDVKRWRDVRSARFAYFASDRSFVVVAGEQEGREVDLAFARGLTYRDGRRLILVLPERHAFATLQRAPWFTATARPEVYLHDGHIARRRELPTQHDTVNLLKTLKPGKSPEDELREAATPMHLGLRSAIVYDLVEWATTEPRLDASHRRGERSWHCMGQRVLSITGTTAGLAITAGIHYSKPGKAPTPLKINTGASIDPGQLETIKCQVRAGITERLAGTPPIHRPDEHWLQAVVRRDPSLVGVEQPALRELPAWRPSGDGTSWARGYIDLIGVDGHGDIRLVETKLTNNSDDLLVFQGLDYYIWATAYHRTLLDRLGAADRAVVEIHYVIGDTANGDIHVSKFVPEQARSLDPVIRWRFQTIHKWYTHSIQPARPTSILLPPGELPLRCRHRTE
jgi:hypothetical protein